VLMTNTGMHTVYFTKLFTGGTLKGLTYHGSISYPTLEACAAFIAHGRKGVRKPIGGSPYKIVDASFQDYRR